MSSMCSTPSIVDSSRRVEIKTPDVIQLLRSRGDTREETRLSIAVDSSTVVVGAFAPDEGPTTPGGVFASFTAGRPVRRRLVGFARATTDFTLVALIEDLTVDRDFEGEGLGKRLIRAVLDELRLLGIGDIGLIAPRGMGAFFERCQFGPDAQGAVLMALKQTDRPDPRSHLHAEALQAQLRKELGDVARKGWRRSDDRAGAAQPAAELPPQQQRVPLPITFGRPAGAGAGPLSIMSGSSASSGGAAGGLQSGRGRVQQPRLWAFVGNSARSRRSGGTISSTAAQQGRGGGAAAAAAGDEAAPGPPLQEK